MTQHLKLNAMNPQPSHQIHVYEKLSAPSRWCPTDTPSRSVCPLCEEDYNIDQQCFYCCESKVTDKVKSQKSWCEVKHISVPNKYDRSKRWERGAETLINANYPPTRMRLHIAEVCQKKTLESVIPLVQIYLGYTTLQNSYLHLIQFQNPQNFRR